MHMFNPKNTDNRADDSAKKHADHAKKHGESRAQKEYLRSLKRYRKKITFMRILLFAAFLLVWEASADLGLIDAFFFSSPVRILSYTLSMAASGELFVHIGVTLAETLLSFLSVMLLSVALASLLWFSKTAADILEPALVILNSLPKSALAPLIIVWLGSGMKTIIVAGISVAVFGSVLSLYTQFSATPPELEKLIVTLGGGRREIYRHIVLPGSVETLINSMKVNIGLALVGVIIGEFLAARRGLGYLIIYGTQVFKLDMVISSIIILCFIAYGLYLIIQALEKKLVFSR